MRLLTPSGARNFCQGFSASANTRDVDVGKYLDRFQRGRTFRERTRDFESLRDCLLRDAERQTFLAASNFANAHRGLQASSASWTLVGLYYTSYYAARAILAMHGGWVDANRRWLGLTDLTTDALEFTYYRSPHTAIPRKHGTHKAFWNVFYHAVSALEPYADVAHSYALSPVQSSATWLIDNRNKINYQPAMSMKLVSDFFSRYDPASIPAFFPGDLKVQLNVATSLLAITAQFRVSHGLRSDLNICGQPDLNAAIDQLIRLDTPNPIKNHCRTMIDQFSA